MNQTTALLLGIVVTFLVLALIGYLTEGKKKCGACSCTCGVCPSCKAQNGVKSTREHREYFGLKNTDIPQENKGEGLTADQGYYRNFTVHSSRS
jgi:hypothetical protein